MPRARGEKRYLNFLRGLNTEESLVDFPVDSTTDERNFRVDLTGRKRVRRKGLKQESTTELGTGRTDLTVDAITTFEWLNVAEKSEHSFLVSQHGAWLNFLDITLPDPVARPKNFSFDLLARKLGTSTNLEVTSNRVQMASLKGRLIVAGEHIIPFILEYDPDTDDIVGRQILISTRDLEGVDDSLQVDNRPATLTEEHEYNLYNQGWYEGKRKHGGAGTYTDPVSDFFTDLSVYPSNADIVYFGAKTDGSGDELFDPKTLKDLSLGNTGAPKGHFVLWEFDKRREFFRNNKTISGADTGIGVTIASSPIRPL